MRRAARPLLLLLLLLAIGAASGEEKPGGADRDVVARARDALRDGVRFLIDTQNEDGSWGRTSARNPYQLYAPVPGAHRAFQVATSALAFMALLGEDEETEGAREAVRRGLAYLVRAGPGVKRSHGSEIYAVWGWGYGLQALARALAGGVPGAGPDEIRKTAAHFVHCLATHRQVDGGWGYFDFNAETFRPASGTSMSFTTAAILLAAYEARDAGIPFPDDTLARAKRLLLRCRTPEGTYLYSFSHRYYPEGGINRPQGSLTRTPACDLALALGGNRAIDAAVLRKGVENLLDKAKFARMALHRPVPHQSWFSVSGYFCLYGYYYASEVCRRLPAGEVRPLRDGLIREILVTRDKDGSFWDYPMYGYHKPYGTGYAVLALRELLRERK